MQTQIVKLFTNNVNTRFGQKLKYDVYVNIEGKELKFQTWQGLWNKDWQIGTTIDLPPTEDQRWKKDEYQGKTYLTLKAPPETMHGGQGGGSTPQQTNAYSANVSTDPGPSKEDMERITALIEEINLKNDRILAELAAMAMARLTEGDDEDDIPIIPEDPEDAKIDIPL